MKRYILVAVALITCALHLAYADDYSIEFKNAYNYAHNKGVTTVDSIWNARMYQSMTRVEMAKMISNFSINVLGLHPDYTKDCQFYDVSPDLDAQYSYGVTQACKLGLMGIYDDGSKADYFNPYNDVTRGEWATVFSRALNKSKGTNISNGDPFYKTHMNYLISKGIINNYNKPSPNSEEKRGNVMLMMYRADPNNIVTVDYKTGYTKLSPRQTYYNTFYGFEIEHAGDYSWLIEISSDSDGAYISYNSFIPQKSGDYELSHDYNDSIINEYKENAKSFNETGLLIHLQTWGLTKKGSNNYRYWEDEGEWRNGAGTLTNPNSKGYIIYQDVGMGIQESPYVYVGKDTENIGEFDSWYKLGEIIGSIDIIGK